MSPPTGQHAWARLRGWEILLVIAVLVPSARILAGDLAPPWKAVTVALLLSVLVAYALVGRRAILTEDVRLGTIYVAVLVALFAPVSLVESSTTFALFGICPQIFMALPSRRAMVAVVLLAIPEATSLWMTRPGLDGIYNLMTLLTTVVFFSAVFGVWGERIVRQSAERAALIRQLEATHAEVARLSAERGALTERERLAGEIHDTLAQGFTSIIMLLQAAEAQPDPRRHLELAVQTAKENLAEARALVAALSPAPLDGSTLNEALRRVTDRLGEELGPATVFEARGDGRALPPQYEVVLVRAAQEGLNNVRKHAAASRVEVTLEYGRREVTLRVRDDGRGFGSPPASPAAGQAREGSAAGYGLQAMRARVEQVQGSITVGGAEAGGAELVVRLPLPAHSPPDPATAGPVPDPVPDPVRDVRDVRDSVPVEAG